MILSLLVPPPPGQRHPCARAPGALRHLAPLSGASAVLRLLLPVTARRGPGAHVATSPAEPRAILQMLRIKIGGVQRGAVECDSATTCSVAGAHRPTEPPPSPRPPPPGRGPGPRLSVGTCRFAVPRRRTAPRRAGFPSSEMHLPRFPAPARAARCNRCC